MTELRDAAVQERAVDRHEIRLNEISEAVSRLCANFTLDYWAERDSSATFPEEFYREIGRQGWLGVAIPEEFGGSGLGILEAATIMEAVGSSGGGMSACSSIHINIFGINPVVKFGTEEQKKAALPSLIQGQEKACFAVTEPNAGLDTANIQTRAVRDGDIYRVSGEKVWISTAQVADKVLLLARTKPKDQCHKPVDGLSLFYTKLDRDYVDIVEIEKMGRHAIDSNQLFFRDMPVPVADRIGEEGLGFRYILHGINPERILVAAEAVGIGRAALRLAVKYAKERVVFSRPIGQNQSIQHPLAHSWAQLEGAWYLTRRAAELYDAGEPCGAEANAAKLLAAEAAVSACQRAMLTYGGYGYAKEYHVERLMREVMLTMIAPVSPQMILCNIAEKKLGLPKSY
jgi:acyl-CoA dehydrogenase